MHAPRVISQLIPAGVIFLSIYHATRVMPVTYYDLILVTNHV